VDRRASIRAGWLEAEIKPERGKEDQAGGLIFRFVDANNYYVVRINALEDNVVLFKTVNGKRTPLQVKGRMIGYGVDATVPNGKWSRLRVEFRGPLFKVFYNDEPLFEVEDRTFVAAGAVGSRWAGRFRIFRYEIRLWRNGHIPDVAEAVASPRRLSNDEDRARRVLDVVAKVPTPVWGRDELGTGEMWNSNSVIAWVIASSGIDPESIRPPAGGRAPGWRAGLEVARRQAVRT